MTPLILFFIGVWNIIILKKCLLKRIDNNIIKVRNQTEHRGCGVRIKLGFSIRRGYFGCWDVVVVERFIEIRVNVRYNPPGKNGGCCTEIDWVGKITFICIVYPPLARDTFIDPVSRIFTDLVDASLVSASKPSLEFCL